MVQMLESSIHAGRFSRLIDNGSVGCPPTSTILVKELFPSLVKSASGTTGEEPPWKSYEPNRLPIESDRIMLDGGIVVGRFEMNPSLDIGTEMGRVELEKPGAVIETSRNSMVALELAEGMFMASVNLSAMSNFALGSFQFVKLEKGADTLVHLPPGAPTLSDRKLEVKFPFVNTIPTVALVFGRDESWVLTSLAKGMGPGRM